MISLDQQRSISFKIEPFFLIDEQLAVRGFVNDNSIGTCLQINLNIQQAVLAIVTFLVQCTRLWL